MAKGTGTYRQLSATDCNNLSEAQYQLLRQLRKLPDGETLSPPSGRSSSAWWRTAQALVSKGYAQENGYVLMPVGKRAKL